MGALQHLYLDGHDDGGDDDGAVDLPFSYVIYLHDQGHG